MSKDFNMTQQQQLMSYFNTNDPNDFIPSVWSGKYAAPNEVTPDDMHRRLAKEFAEARFKKDKSKTLQEWEAYFFDWFKNFERIIPQGRVMAGLGRYDSYRSLSNCLRLPPPKDSYNSILYVDSMMAASAKRGCGYGLGLSNLRPVGAVTANAAGTSSGITSWMERYSNTTKEVGQKGRRGACLEDLDIRHPEAYAFSEIKRDKSKVSGANVSFKVWDDFMRAVAENKTYIQSFPVDAKLSIEKYDDWYPNWDDGDTHYIAKDDAYVRVINAKELWDYNIQSVWECGDAGLQFWDRLINYDPASVYPRYKPDGTNACGEQPMAVFDTCRLLVKNLTSIVKDAFTENASIDYDLLYEMSYELVLLGDDLVDLEVKYLDRILDKLKRDPEPIEEKQIEITLWENVKQLAKDGRRMGCGITGFGDMLAALNIKYDSQEALNTTEKVFHHIMKAEFQANIDLAEKYGAFEGWDWNSQYFVDKSGTLRGTNDFYQMLVDEYEDLVWLEKEHGRRSVNWNTIAPTGTVSIVAAFKGVKGRYHNISGGCEPAFSVLHYRNRVVQDGGEYDFEDEAGIRFKTYPVANGSFRAYYDTLGLDKPFEELSREEADAIEANSPWKGSLAGDIDYKARIAIQGVMQKYTCSAISSTVNVSEDTKPEVISEIYYHAWECGLKGITVYRDGSKGGILVHDKKSTEGFEQRDAPKRPKELDCEVHITSVKGNQFSVIVGLLEGKPYEVFALTKKFKKESGLLIKRTRGRYELDTDSITDQDIAEGMTGEQAIITRLISGMLRHGSSVKYVVEQLQKDFSGFQSFSKAIARVLKKYIPDNEIATGVTCENCGSTNIRYQEGCLTCFDCGSSKCG
jgi:ribonucleoside-diphosphate reductase alpha chain